PGDNDYIYEMLKSGNGIVILAAQKAAPYQYVLFKIDFDGAVLWATSFLFQSPINTASPVLGDSQLIEAGGYIYFTGYITLSPTESKMFLQYVDPVNGHGDMPGFDPTCSEYEPVDITIENIANPVFYTVNPQEKIPDFTIQNFTSASRRSFVHSECELKDTLFQQVVTSICEGDSYAGYTQAGSYTDHFVTSSGCDSIRTLRLDVEACLNTCDESFVTVLGSVSGNEKGYAVAASAVENAVYVAGTINDSLMIIRVKSNGMMDWARKFDVIPGKAESINGMILDASGKLAIVGITGVINAQGNLFVCRYDPVNNAMLWVKEETSTSQGFVSGLIEMGPGGPYLIS
ncbi:MAG TPA: hypothetical protein VJ508_18340, partial [Saprospiraceae bacterium]|nr:hypothetical protein [Saprospiraceae bacterium]